MCVTAADDVALLVELEMLKEVAESSKGMGEFAMISAMPGIARLIGYTRYVSTSTAVG